MNNIIQYVKPELLILVPALYLIGMLLKSTERIKDNDIPLTIGIIGIVLASTYILASLEINGWQDVLMAIFVGATQGVICAGLSVYTNQVYRQNKSKE